MDKSAWVQPVRRVDKPWGHEEWFALVPGLFCGKSLHIRAGESLSLQYHEVKEETVSVQSGRLLLEEQLQGRPDQHGLLRGRYPGVYAVAFLLTAALELYGTRLGTWSWAPHDPTGVLSAANPPSGIPGGYCWLDFWALLLAPSAYELVRRAGVALRIRPAPVAPS